MINYISEKKFEERKEGILAAMEYLFAKSKKEIHIWQRKDLTHKKTLIQFLIGETFEIPVSLINVLKLFTKKRKTIRYKEDDMYESFIFNSYQ